MKPALVLATSLLLALGAPAGAAVPAEGSARVLTNALTAISGQPRGELQPVIAYFRGGQLRIDFEDARGARYRLLRPAADAPFVLLDARGGLVPLPGRGFPLRLDPAAPCADAGLMSECRRLGEGIHAGRNAVHWAYRRCGLHGPGGTDAGRMWLDAATGVVLAYDATTAGGGRPVWDVLEIDYGPQPDTVFAPGPEAAPQPAGRGLPAPG